MENTFDSTYIINKARYAGGNGPKVSHSTVRFLSHPGL